MWRKTPINEPDIATKIRVRIFQVLLQIALTGVLLFAAAGTLAWFWGWIYMALSLLSMLINAWVLLRYNPQVVAERAATKTGGKTWDKILVALFGSFAVPGLMLVAGLDHRFGWTSSYALIIHGAGFVLFTLSGAVFLWAMRVNTYFSTDVRIQVDRGHAVIASGPYRFVRHPGYVGLIGGLLAQPLLLGSLWALVPGGIAMIVLLVRTALEDKALQEELEGYRQYARQTPYRLFPGIW